MNVLITSAGRRNYIIEYFRELLNPIGGKVHAMNSDENAASLWISDYWTISPLIYSEEYEDFLLSYCIKNKIFLIISLFDIELPILSKLKPIFLNHNIQIIVGEEWLTQMANDKWETNNFLNKYGFNTKPCFKSLNDFLQFRKDFKLDFPVFVKPRWGMASLSIYKADSMSELEFYYKLVHKQIKTSYLKFESQLDWDHSVLIQSQFPGEEFGLDIINDLEGNYCTTIVKKKIAMRAGETDIAVTVNIPQLKDLGERLSKITKHPGNLDVDVFFDGELAFVLEINARFSGSYPFSHAAGVNLPKAIINWYFGEKVDKNWLTEKFGVTGMKGISLFVKPNN
jgi:carbamoyl-phosphate synthase large subunit